MDDAAFERWSDALEAMRLSRKADIEQELQEKADSFKPAEFYQMAQRGIAAIMERWFSIEQEASPVLAGKELQTVRAEMDSIFDFELEAIERDAAMITSRITWRPEDLEEARKSFLPLAEEIRKKYQIKLKSLSPGEVKNPFLAEPLRAVQYSGSASGSGSGLVALVMLLIGFFLGGAMSLYFRDSEHKIAATFEAEKKKILADQRALADGMALLHSSFADLVLGKSQPIPQLQAEMGRIQKMVDDRIYIINSDTADQRAHLTKRMTGDRLNRALDDLERDRARRVKKLEDEYKPTLRVYEKRIALYKDLLGSQP